MNDKTCLRAFLCLKTERLTGCRAEAAVRFALSFDKPSPSSYNEDDAVSNQFRKGAGGKS